MFESATLTGATSSMAMLGIFDTTLSSGTGFICEKIVLNSYLAETFN